MRIARLDLEAFGPFTDRSLDFSGGSPGGFHLIYGKNAAGKSSALRAVSDLLFGIPLKSKDDHVHPYQALRIRALIENPAKRSEMGIRGKEIAAERYSWSRVSRRMVEVYRTALEDHQNGGVEPGKNA